MSTHTALFSFKTVSSNLWGQKMSPKTGLQMWMKKSVKLALAENP